MAYLFLTLTVKNCTGAELKETIDTLQKGFMRMVEYKQIDKAWKGYFKALEITHDCDVFISKNKYDRGKKHYDKLGLKPGDKNPNYDMFHPHIHAMIPVNESYFTHGYIKIEDYVKLWRKACKLDYDPIAHIKRVRANDKKIKKGQEVAEFNAIAEVAKYAVKPEDLLYFSDWQLTKKTVSLLDKALNRRRFIGMGGIIKQYHKKLNLDDVEDGSLDNTTGEVNIYEKEELLTFAWLSGYNQYVRV
jgi:plasmid rolling circle replication initiator protein Rep